MKIEKVMKTDENLVKSQDEAETKNIFNNSRKIIKPVVFSSSSGPKVGAGWSIGEIRSAGLTRRQMKRFHLGIDKFRKSTHEDNVEILRKIKPIAKVK